ncbi:hypothetical protein [Halopseudomonas sp.]|jgi:hypothetical protein|uniref:hypothetical protein n=1 Tax=Halopseudomonas sp. TaxID=2901191 RepID=UPI0039E5DF0E
MTARIQSYYPMARDSESEDNAWQDPVHPRIGDIPMLQYDRNAFSSAVPLSIAYFDPVE